MIVKGQKNMLIHSIYAKKNLDLEDLEKFGHAWI